MFILVAISILLGFAVIFFLKKSSCSVAPEEDYYRDVNLRRTTLAEPEAIDLESFERICLKLLEKIGLETKSLFYSAGQQIDIVAHNPQPLIGGEFIIHCRFTDADDGELVESSNVIALSDTVKAERASKGIFITNGYFSAEVGKLSEGAPIELINGKRLRELMQQYQLAEE